MKLRGPTGLNNREGRRSSYKQPTKDHGFARQGNSKFRIDVACISAREATGRHVHGPCSFVHPIHMSGFCRTGAVRFSLPNISAGRDMVISHCGARIDDRRYVRSVGRARMGSSGLDQPALRVSGQVIAIT